MTGEGGTSSSYSTGSRLPLLASLSSSSGTDGHGKSGADHGHTSGLSVDGADEGEYDEDDEDDEDEGAPTTLPIGYIYNMLACSIVRSTVHYVQ